MRGISSPSNLLSASEEGFFSIEVTMDDSYGYHPQNCSVTTYIELCGDKANRRIRLPAKFGAKVNLLPEICS
jgi:hypothetical protein